MNFTQSFKLAIKSLLLSKMRALLTMLGIIIGVAAVIIITSLGNGMQNYMNAQFEQLGSNLIQVMVYGRGEGGTRDVSTECVRHSQGAAGNGGLRPHQHLRRQRGILPRRHPEDHAGLQPGEWPLPPLH